MATRGRDSEKDEILAERARAGDRAAWEQLLARHQRKVLRLTRQVCGNASDAEEVAQEAFLQAFRGISSWKGEARFATWLHRIALNAALMRRRADRRRPVVALPANRQDLDQAGDGAGAEPEASGLRADLLLDRKRLTHSVLAALGRLAAIYRTAFLLHLEGLGMAEAARVLGASKSAVRQRVHRARLLLREQLAPLMSAG